MQPFIVSIEGNIGAGKSTIFNKLQEYYYGNPYVVFMREPVDLWEDITDENGENMLSKYYADPTQYSFGFQTMVYVSQAKTYMETLLKHPECKIIISERSMDAGRNVFTKMLKDDNMIDEIHYKIYEMMFSLNKYNLNLVFYVDVATELCHERIIRRSRDGETDITIDYLKNCEDYYFKWLFERCDCDASTNVITVNGNTNDNGEQCSRIIIHNLDSYMYELE